MQSTSSLLRLAALTLFFVPAALFAQARTAPPSPEQSIDLKALLDDYRALQPAARGIGVRDRSALIGHLEIALEDGAIFPLRSPRGEMLGLYFEGAGRYTYRSEDPADRQIIEANMRRETSAPIYYQFAVRDTFKRALLFFAAPALQAIEPPDAPGHGEGSPAPPAAPELTVESRSRFDRIWKQVMMTYLKYDHLAAEARLNGGDRQYVYAEMEGGRETVGYTFDRVDDFKERLFHFHKRQGSDIRFENQLSEQPIDGGEAAHPLSMLLRDARIDLSTADNRSASIVSDLTFESTTDGVRIVRLGLLNHRDTFHHDWSSAKNRLDIKLVTDEEGHELPFSHRYHEILIQLPTPLHRGQALRLHFETKGEILTEMNGQRYDNYFDLMGEPWYPQPLSRRSGGWTFSLRVRTKKPFIPVVAGVTTAFREAGDFYEIEASSARPASEIAVFAGKYKSHEEKFDDITIRAHAYAMALQEVLKKLPRVAHQFLQFYERTLGPYPFGDLNILEAPEKSDNPYLAFAFGIGPPGMVLITSEAYSVRRDRRTMLMSQGVNQRLAHEIAHQWFPHKAMPASTRDEWLSESFAEYLSGLALENFPVDERDRVSFPMLLSAWQFEAKSCRDEGSIEAADMLSGPDAYQHRQCLLYSRGPLVLHMLRAMAGQERFVAILRLYLERANMGPVTTDDFRKAAEDVLKVDLGWFFDDWYRKGGIADIRVKYDLEPLGGGRFALVGRAEQAAGPSFRRILIPLVLDYDDGRREARLVFQDEPSKEFRIELAAKPKKISVDPGQNNLAAYH